MADLFKYSDEMLLQYIEEINNKIFRCTSTLLGIGPTGENPAKHHTEKAIVYGLLHERCLERADTALASGAGTPSGGTAPTSQEGQH